MKRISLLLVFCVVLLSIAHAQVPPNAFNYSAIARNAAGDPIATSTIGIQITILKTSPTGASQYSENHFVNTDAFGLFNLAIGAGSVQSGNMATIDWSNDTYYLKVGMDANGGSSFLTMGTTQLLSVPYALYAKSAGSVGGTGSSVGNLIFPTITTNPVTDIGSNSARLGGVISNANENHIMERGIVYATSSNPTLASNKIVMGGGIGAFDTIPELGYFSNHSLNANTTYYVRAYAITENNIYAFGNEVSFTTQPIGQTGPGGGIVFFDKGNNNGGWQYLEAASSDQSTGIEWGCYGTAIPGTQWSVGSGDANTTLIVAGCNETTFAAKLCADLTLGGQTDWFLPSVDELDLMFRNLHVYGQGNFDMSTYYWSSAEFDYNIALVFDFGNEWFNTFEKYNTGYVRAVRAF
jgi:hypothetical protein